MENTSTIEWLVTQPRACRDEALFSSISKGDIDDINPLPTKIPGQLFQKTVDKIFSARATFIHGLRSSYPLAFCLAFSLWFLLHQAILVRPGIGNIPE